MRRFFGELPPLAQGGATDASGSEPETSTTGYEDSSSAMSQCKTMEETWRRLWVTNVALTAYGAFGGAVGSVSESACWRLARELWPALAHAQGNESDDSDGTDTDGAEAEPDGRPAGSWTDRCG